MPHGPAGRCRRGSFSRSMARARSIESEFPPVEVVPMEHADLAKVLGIEAQAFEDPWPRQAFESDLADPALAFMRVARADDRVAGYLVAWRVAGELHLT